ncbi:vitellogenin receptor-like isoform X2 [Portunus trituberculatus]|uniref:vitellogenin receptor-like isoform X2 n=1 Tax=Portunus trituberculatus TaxID=210409 RepID=UPI001E1CCF32|nr:vitellogenin receptor-like isoform X2 [Portunus trituberculatus]
MAGVAKLLALLMTLALAAAQQECSDSDEISCSSGESRCIPYRYICDSDPDCDAGSEDEDPELCEAWKNNECNRGQVQCRRDGDTTCINIYEYCDPSSNCEGDLDIRICKMIRDGQVKPLSEIQISPYDTYANNDLLKTENLAKEFVLLLNRTIQHPRCPTMFTLVGDQCLALFFVGSVSWGEARSFCQVLGGDLITFRDVSHYTAVVNHLREAQLTVDFWVGGSLANETEGWRWIDDSSLELGTPYWAVRYEDKCQHRNVTFPELNQTREANDGACYHYLQAPDSPPRGRCVALPYEHYYYMTDENCLKKKSPLCVLSEEQAPV